MTCIGDHTITADYDEIHTEYIDRNGVTHPIEYVEHDACGTDECCQACDTAEVTVNTRTKPHYVYSARTGVLTLVESTHSDEEAVTDWDMIADAFGL